MPPHLPNDDEPAKGGVQKRATAAYSRPIIDFSIPRGAEVPPGPGPEPERKWPRAALALAACGVLLAGSGYAVTASLQQPPGSGEAGGHDPTMPLIAPPYGQSDEEPASAEANQSAQTTVTPAEAEDPPSDTRPAPPPADPPPPGGQEAEGADAAPADPAPPGPEDAPGRSSGLPAQGESNGQGPPGGTNGQGPPQGVPRS